MNWCVPRIWEGGDVWILGGGPSVTRQFEIPDSVVEEVRKGVSPPTTYSPYMEALHDKHVIGINVAYLIGDWMDMVFFGDNKFFLAHRERLATWPGLKVSCHSSTAKIDWVKHLERDTTHPRGISPDPRKISWNCNSGASAVSVAANAGAKRIILLGFDMTINGNGNRHWHNLYHSTVPVPPNARGRGGLPRAVHLPFDRHLRGFPDMARDAKLRGIEILNVCPESAITVFPKITLEDVLR